MNHFSFFRVLKLLLIGILTMGLCACGASDTEQDPVEQPSAEQTPEPEPEPEPVPDPIEIWVMSEPYGAKGDGVTNDRAAIQKAIDDANAAPGGGIVHLNAGKTFLTGNLLLRSNVELHFEDGAKILQSGDPMDFVKPTADGKLEPWKPIYGHDFSPSNWGHALYYNYPLIYASEGTKHIAVTGKGTIEMTRGASCEDTLHLCPIGMYGVSYFEISDITIQRYNTYAIHPYNSDHGLLKNITVKDPADGNGDGFSMANCQDMRITGCDLTTSDDGIYIYSVYNDPRTGFTWNSTANPIPSKNYEIDHNHCKVTWDATKALAFIVWGANCPDQRQMEVSNIYIHDNYFQTMGAWTGNWGEEQFDFNGKTSPMKNIRFENNEIGTIQSNFYTLQVSDFYGFDSSISLHNGDFESTGDAWWSVRQESGATAGAGNDNVGQTGKFYGYIDGLDRGDAAIYQGVQLTQGIPYCMQARVMSNGDSARLFVKNRETGELIASKTFKNTQWETVSFRFEAEETGTYYIGLERGDAKSGWARIDDVVFSPSFDDIANDPEDVALMPDALPEEVSDGGGYRNELGVRFTPKVNGTITKVRVYTGEREAGIHYVSIWNYKTRALVSEELYEWSIIPGYEGWREFELPEPVSVKKGTEYVVSVSAGPDCLFVVNKSMDQVIENEYLTTPATSGISTANALTDFNKMPTNIIPGWNFLRDFEFVPD